MKLLLDMNIPLKYSALLINKGVHVTRWQDIGKPNAPDTEIMAYAKKNGFVVLTYDLDFSQLLSITHNIKPSIIQIRAAINDAAAATDLIIMTLSRYEDSLNAGAIISIDIKRTRVRLLPI
jgi:predicted nuclease of predicted toxin-antitoxin system